MPFPGDLKYFEVSEFKHPELMNVPFLRWLDRVRGLAGVPFALNDDARVPSATEPVGSAGSKSLHRRGRAVDIRSRDWTAAQKWKVSAAIHALADEAPGKVEFEPVFSPTDRHWHLGVDDRPEQVHEFVESDE